MGWTLERFQRELKKFDPLLRCRLSYYRDNYIIERKISHGSAWGVKPDEKRGHDFWIQAKEGYVHCLRVRRDLLGPLVFNHLMATDVWANGGAERVADQMDEADAQRERNVEQEQSNYLDAKGREVYDKHMWMQGDVVAGFNSKVGGMEFANPQREVSGESLPA